MSKKKEGQSSRAKRATAANSARRRIANSDQSSKRSSPEATLTLAWREVYALFPVALAFATSANALSNGFAYDDLQQVLNNDFIRSPSNLPAAFSTNVWAFLGEELLAAQDTLFRPLFTALFTLNYSIFGAAPWGWHLMNVLIHSAVTFFVFLVCREITGGRQWIALTAAALFAVHPAHAESVAWVSGVTDPLMALFALPSIYFYLLYRKTARPHLFAATLGLFLLALWSKETAIVLPVLIAYCELFLFGRSAALRERLYRVMLLSVLIGVPTVVYLLMRHNAIGSIAELGDARYSLGLALKTTPLVIAKYLKLMFVPSSYSIHHFTAPLVSIATPEFLMPVVMLAAIIGAILMIRSPVLSVAAVWFILWLAPPIAGIRVFQPLYFVQERYLYVPSMGVCLAVALGIGWLAKRNLHGVSGPVAAAILTLFFVVYLGVVTIGQNTAWHDTVTLYRRAVAADPRDPLAHTALAGAYFAQGKTREAETEAQTALRIDPACIDSYLVSSVLAHASGKSDEATTYLQRAESMVREGPQRRGYLATIYSKLAFLCNQSKSYESAEEYLRRVVALTPSAGSWLELGDFYFDRARYPEALDTFQQVLVQVGRRFAPIHLKIARTYDRMGEKDLARNEYEKYLQLAPLGAPGRVEATRRLTQF